MKKVYIVLSVLLLCIIAQAQKITEKDLVGTWRFKIMDAEGFYVDFENDSLYVAERDNMPPDTKSYYPILKEQAKNSYVVFEPGLTMKIKFASTDPEKTQVKLIEKDDRQYLSQGKEERLIVIKDGLLHIYPPQGPSDTTGKMYLVLRKE